MKNSCFPFYKFDLIDKKINLVQNFLEFVIQFKHKVLKSLIRVEIGLID